MRGEGYGGVLSIFKPYMIIIQPCLKVMRLNFADRQRAFTL